MDESSRLDYDIQVNLRRLIITAESMNEEWQNYGSHDLMNKLAEEMGYGDVEQIVSLSSLEMKEDDDGEEKEKKYESTALKADGFYTDAKGKEKKLKMHYKCGPVKRYDRSSEKVESDYSASEYPQSSRLIDLIRCSITVDTVAQLLALLQSLIKLYSSETEQFVQQRDRQDTGVHICLFGGEP